MRLMRPSDKHSSPCSKTALVEGIKVYAQDHPKYKPPPLDKLTRHHLIEVAAELDILIQLESRAEIIKILKGAGIEFDDGVDTYLLVGLATDHANARYGVSDIDSLGKNLKKSPFSKSYDEEELEETKAKYRAKLQVGG
jgi:hypothetical protein